MREEVRTEIVDLKLSDLAPTENNPRQISKKDFDVLKKSIQDFPEMLKIREVVVDENNRILGGHQRVKALQANGVDTVTVKRVTGLTEEQKREFVIKDNIANGEWDMDILANEWDDLPLTDWGLDVDWQEEEQEVVEDEVPEPPEEPKSKLGDIYQLGNHRLMCGDSTKAEDVEKLMNGVNADMLITDPPYNIAYDGGSKKRDSIENDDKNENDFREFLSTCYLNAIDNMQSGAAFYIWLASTEIYSFIGAGKDIGLTTREILVWNKNNSTFGRQDYQWKHELCLYGWKEGSAHKWYSDRKQTTVLDFDRPSRSDEHPTMKPVGLIAYQIANNSAKDDNVLDLFGGSGSTLIACEQLNRKCYMMELDPHYVDVIIERWENFTGEKAKLITKGTK